jgi:hypothetical protein
MLVSLILYTLGVPLWMVLGMLLLAFWNGRRVKKQPGIFPVKVRFEADPGAEKETKWPRQVSYAQWVHDVLIVRKGPGLMLTTPYGISAVEGSPRDAEPGEVKGMGEHPKIVRAQLDDGSILQVAVRELHPQLAPEHFSAAGGQE